MKRAFYVNHTDSEAGFISGFTVPTPYPRVQWPAVGSRTTPPTSIGLSAPALPRLCRRHTPHRQPARPFNPSSAPHGAQRPAWSGSEGNTRPAAAQRIAPSPAEPGPGCLIPPTIPPSASAAGLRVPGLLWSTGHPTPVPPSTAPDPPVPPAPRLPPPQALPPAGPRALASRPTVTSARPATHTPAAAAPGDRGATPRRKGRRDTGPTRPGSPPRPPQTPLLRQTPVSSFSAMPPPVGTLGNGVRRASAGGPAPPRPYLTGAGTTTPRRHSESRLPGALIGGLGWG